MPRASAQLTNGTIMGAVVDSQSAAVVGATVSLVSETRGHAPPECGHEHNRRIRLA